MAVAAPASVPAGRKHNLFHRIWKARAAYLFIAPAFIPFLIFVVYPLLEGLRLSFFKAGLNRNNWAFIGFQNFFNLANDDVFRVAVVNTLLYVLIIVPITILLTMFAAVIIYPLRRGPQSFVRMAFYMPVVAGGVILGMVWIWIFNRDFGVLNYVLESLGVFKLLGIDRIGWLAQTHTALISLSIVVISWSLGQPFILFLAALGGIPVEIYDAAKIDGGNSWKIFWRITVPLLRPTTLFVFVTQTMAVFQVFVVVLLMTQGGPANATQSIVFRIYEHAFIFYKFGYAAAMGVVLLAIVSVVAAVQFKLLGREVQY